MKAFTTIVALVIVSAVLALAGPAQRVCTVPTAGTNLAIPASGSMAFQLQAVIFAAEAATTQTVSVVHTGAITNQLATHVVSATSRMLTVTNCPWLFSGETIRIVPSSGATNSALLVGVTGN